MLKPVIYIAVPTCRDWKADFGMSMAMLTAQLATHAAQGKIDGFLLDGQVNSLLPSGRQDLLNNAIESGATHILWIDDDTKFTPDAVDLFLSRDVDYVAANMVRKKVGGGAIACDANGQTIDSGGKTGIQEAAWIGLGFCLMKLEPLKNIPAPHFEIIWMEDKKKYLGEDMYFCEILRRSGIKMHIDHDVSNMVGHIGNFSYGYTTS